MWWVVHGATPKSPPTRRVPPRGTPRVPAPLPLSPFSPPDRDRRGDSPAWSVTRCNCRLMRQMLRSPCPLNDFLLIKSLKPGLADSDAHEGSDVNEWGGLDVGSPELRSSAKCRAHVQSPGPLSTSWRCHGDMQARGRVATREESGVLGFPSRRGLTHWVFFATLNSF